MASSAPFTRVDNWDGEAAWAPTSGAYMPVTSPLSGAVIGEVAMSTAVDVETAVANAQVKPFMRTQRLGAKGQGRVGRFIGRALPSPFVRSMVLGGRISGLANSSPSVASVGLFPSRSLPFSPSLFSPRQAALEGWQSRTTKARAAIMFKFHQVRERHRAR
jgi:hypothetical protein